MPDCWTCRHSMGGDIQTAKHMHTHRGYRVGRGDMRHGVVLWCEATKQTYPTRCERYEREPGSDDE